MAPSDASQPSGPEAARPTHTVHYHVPRFPFVDSDDDGYESLGSDVLRGSVPESVSYCCGETPPLRPNLASSEDLAQDTLRLSTSQESAYVAADTTSTFSSGFAARVSPIPFPPLPPPLPPLPSLGLSKNLSPSYRNTASISVEVLDDTVKETDISTLPRPIVTWDPATLYWDPDSPRRGAPTTNFSQNLDSDSWSTRATDSSSDESIKPPPRKRPGKRRVSLKGKFFEFISSLDPKAPSTPRLQSGHDPLEGNESQKQKSEGTRNPHVADPEPLKPSKTFRSHYHFINSENERRNTRQPSPTPSVESLQSLVDSIFSLASVSSASTAPGLDNVFQRVLAVLQGDAILKDLYVELRARTSAIKFKRNFGILLKRFAVDLENESSCYDEQRTAKFIRIRAKNIAQAIVDAVYPSGPTMIRGQISTSLGQTRAESSEDSGTDEEPDEYLELEEFVTNSRSFQKLRDNIRAFLGLELSKLLAELPFVEENQVVEYEESTNSAQSARSGGKTLWSMQKFYQNFRNLLLPESPIPNGLSRVRWKCPCGETLHDDYQELKSGAAKRMEDYLRRSSYKKCAAETKSFSERISNLWGSFKGTTTFFTQWTQTLKNNGKTTIVNTELRYYSDARTTRTPAHTSGEVFYLLLCHNSGVGAEVVKLRQPDICDINNDQKLFSFLREEYLALRKRWWTWISLWTLQSIKFVRFELYENELVDVKKLDDVPPPTKDHEYRHGPPNPPELNPPLGSTLLMHLFKHPELAGTKKKCLQKIPRKLRTRLAVLDESDDAIGWGLQFIEGWSKKRLMYMAALTFGFSSAVVMILVSILGHDVQNAGAIASFMLSFVTIGIATAQAAMHMN